MARTLSSRGDEEMDVGVEDSEPLLKRVKESPMELNGFLGNSSCSNPTDLSFQGDEDMVGSKGIIRKQEFIKVITKALYSLGYNKTGALLEEESGISLHSSTVSLFMQQVLDGKWDESMVTLRKLGISDDTLKSASFLILEQKFLELLQSSDRVHELDACATANSRSQILGKLQKLLPASLIIPDRRLEHLVGQALDIQRSSCDFHNTLDSELSLYTDHHCDKSQIPSQTLQILQEHNDEVWYLEFSHNGKYLASASKDESTIIWENQDGHLSLKHRLMGHKKPVATLSWSPDDSQILTCGLEEAVRRWDVNSSECLHVYEKQWLGLVSCEWFPDGKGVISCVTDKSISMWDLNGKEVDSCTDERILRISHMVMTGDGRKVITICIDGTILVVDKETKCELLIKEDQHITSLSLSKDNRFLLVNLPNQEIHLWSIEDEVKVVSMYKGHKNSRFVIRSCYGAERT